jgi:hypothetical protein
VALNTVAFQNEENKTSIGLKMALADASKSEKVYFEKALPGVQNYFSTDYSIIDKLLVKLQA